MEKNIVAQVQKDDITATIKKVRRPLSVILNNLFGTKLDTIKYFLDVKTPIYKSKRYIGGEYDSTTTLTTCTPFITYVEEEQKLIDEPVLEIDGRTVTASLKFEKSLQISRCGLLERTIEEYPKEYVDRKVSVFVPQYQQPNVIHEIAGRTQMKPKENLNHY